MYNIKATWKSLQCPEVINNPCLTHTQTPTRNFPNTAHQLSLSCHECGQSAENVRQLLLDFSSTEGTIKMMSLGGRTAEEDRAHHADPVQGFAIRSCTIESTPS